MQQLGDEAMTEEKNVKSLEKALDIIEIVSNEQQDASLSEIARQTGLPKSTAHRLIATLTGRGYLEKTEAGNNNTSVYWIWKHFAFRYISFSWHFSSLLKLYSRYSITIIGISSGDQSSSYVRSLSPRCTLNL